MFIKSEKLKMLSYHMKTDNKTLLFIQSLMEFIYIEFRYLKVMFVLKCYENYEIFTEIIFYYFLA
jgi:hypothetical protein